MRFSELKPITSKEEQEALVKAAEEDNHCPVFASHYLNRERDGIVGFAGLEDYVPFVHIWTHTKKMAAPDSFSVLNAIENYLRLKKKKGLIIPAHSTSTFNGHLQRAGYAKLFDTTIFFKPLT